MWFALSLTVTGDVSHSSRCGNVSGWRLISPFANHRLRRARLSSAMRLAQRDPELVTTDFTDFTDLLGGLDRGLRGRETSVCLVSQGRNEFGCFQSVARSGQESIAQGLPWESFSP